MYDTDREHILHLHALGVPLTTISEVHLKYGKYFSLKNYMAKLQRPGMLLRNWPSRRVSPICLTTPFIT